MAYFYKMKLQMQVSLTYRFEVVANLLTRGIIIIANIFLWNCVYSDNELIAGVDKKQMITYSVMSVCLGVMYECGIQNKINRDIKQGSIAIMLIKPFHLLKAYFAEDVGSVIVKTLFISLPIWLVGIVAFGVQMPVSLNIIPLLIISYIVGYLILWFLGTLVSMMTFITMELGNMGVVKDVIVAILSGSMVPLWFFPNAVEKFLMFTPFPYTFQLPLGLYIGKISYAEGLRQIGIQFIWMAVFAGILHLVWKKVQNKVLIQGG